MDSALKDIHRELGVYGRRKQGFSHSFFPSERLNESRLDWSVSTIGGISLRSATVFTRSADKIIVTRETNSGAQQPLFSADIIQPANGETTFRLDDETVVSAQALVGLATRGWDVRS